MIHVCYDTLILLDSKGVIEMRKYKLTEAEARQLALKEASTLWKPMVQSMEHDYTEEVAKMMIRYNQVMNAVKAYNQSVDDEKDWTI